MEIIFDILLLIWYNVFKIKRKEDKMKIYIACAKCRTPLNKDNKKSCCKKAYKAYIKSGNTVLSIGTNK